MRNFKILLPIFLLLFSTNFVVRAENIDSTNFSIKDFSFGNTNSNTTSSSNYSVLLSLNTSIKDARFNSTNYTLGTGSINSWQANVPLVKCFETTTSGSSSCDSPSVANGMTQVCGGTGCFDKARFEIDSQNNPSTTLYSVQITTDPTWTNLSFVDGATYVLKSSLTLNDYVTESTWESNTFNIVGLVPGTTYYLRITALNGNFTESIPSPVLSTTTTYPSIEFSIYTGLSNGTPVQTTPPFTVSFNNLNSLNPTTATNLVYVNLSTNFTNGVALYTKSTNNGLLSIGGSYTIPSANSDLGSVEGYGLQKLSASQQALGPINVQATFSNSGNIVGGISNVGNGSLLLNTSSSPVNGGQAGFYVKARAGVLAPARSDYTDTIVFTVL